MKKLLIFSLLAATMSSSAFADLAVVTYANRSYGFATGVNGEAITFHFTNLAPGSRMPGERECMQFTPDSMNGGKIQAVDVVALGFVDCQ